jgi:hypothetical protein
MTNPTGDLKPVPPSRVAKELAHLTSMRRNGELDREEYEHKFARMISELRDRRIGGSRQEIHDAINPLIQAGQIDRVEYERFISQLGLG